MNQIAESKNNELHPKDDRMKLLDAAMKRNQFQPDALIEVLHTAQELFGYLEKETLIYISRSLKLPPSKVFGIATFYNFFSLHPKGKHLCEVCMGTACYVNGASLIQSDLENQLSIKTGETTADGKISLNNVRCIGACGISPAVVLDGKIIGNNTTENVSEYVKGWINNVSK